MTQLITLSNTLFVDLLLPFHDVRMVLALSSTCRHFRTLFKTEPVWAALRKRDYPYIAPNQHKKIIQSLLESVARLPTSTVKEVQNVQKRLTQIRDFIRIPYLSGNYDAWSQEGVQQPYCFDLVFVRDAREALRTLPVFDGRHDWTQPE